jgi:hypothetical protein
MLFVQRSLWLMQKSAGARRFRPWPFRVPPVTLRENDLKPVSKFQEVIAITNLAKKISLVFAAGCLGGLINSLAVWIFGEIGITSAIGVKIAPKLSPLWLYPRLIWGGIWGLLFLVPLLPKRIFTKGLVVSMGPTLVQLLVVFPMEAKKGTLGLDLGWLTPVFVIAVNAIWGWTAAIWLKLVGK